MLLQVAASIEEVKTREVFANLGFFEVALFYLLTAITLGTFGYGVYRRVRKYSRGRPAGRLFVPFKRVVVRSAEIGANATVGHRHWVVGLAHFGIFWGFIILFLGTVILTIDTDIVRIAFGEEASFFKGTFYVVYSVILDTWGVVFLAGLAFMALRRLTGPKTLDYKRAEEPPEGYTRTQFTRGDWLFLGLLAVIAITGYLEEGARILATRFPDFEVWSPVGWLIARGFQAAGIDPAGGAEPWRYSLWWIHTVVALGFVAYIPYSKAMHILTDMGNLLFHEESSSRRLPPPNKENGAAGYHDVGDFTWKELLDLDACTKCGRCHMVCPANAAGAPLSPRDLILDLRQWVDSEHGIPSILDHEDRPEPTGPLIAGTGVKVAGDVVKQETLWACTTCMACVEACPVGIEHVSTIIQLRRSLVDEGTMEQPLIDALSNIAQQGNSFGKSSRMRSRWTKGLDFTIPDARKEPVKYLWFVGDFASFDERVQEQSRALARILHSSEVSFGILYEGEWNSGNDVRRVGEEGLFEMLAEHNVEAFSSAQFEEIFTTDPHSLNTLKNEYPDFGASYPVKHYTELLRELIHAGQIKVRPLGRKVTYHDPCYLARYNNVTRAPRIVLESLACHVQEMPRNKENTFCCGAGGGRIWMDDSGLAERPSENRIREAMTLGVDYFVVSCPKDLTMYTDAAKTTGNEDKLKVVDIVTLVEEALVVREPVGATGEAGVAG